MAAGDLAVQLVAARKQLGWSLRTAERASGVPSAHISQIETGTIAKTGPRRSGEAGCRLRDGRACPPAPRAEGRRSPVSWLRRGAGIARLNAELDRYQGRQVLHTTEAHLDDAALASLDEPDGTILRATDTGRELLFHGGTWGER